MEYFIIATERTTPKTSAWFWLGILSVIGLIVLVCK